MRQVRPRSSISTEKLMQLLKVNFLEHKLFPIFPYIFIIFIFHVRFRFLDVCILYHWSFLFLLLMPLMLKFNTLKTMTKEKKRWLNSDVTKHNFRKLYTSCCIFTQNTISIFFLFISKHFYFSCIIIRHYIHVYFFTYIIIFQIFTD